MVMEISHFVEIIGEFLLPLIFLIIYMIMKKYYPGQPVNIHIQSLINIVQENDWLLPPKKVRVSYHYFMVMEMG